MHLFDILNITITENQKKKNYWDLIVKKHKWHSPDSRVGKKKEKNDYRFVNVTNVMTRAIRLHANHPQDQTITYREKLTL